jgi:hypothetical protein
MVTEREFIARTPVMQLMTRGSYIARICGLEMDANDVN